MSFCERLRERRESLNLTRPELAQMIGVTPSAIGNYETGLSHPKPEILYSIFRALDVEPNFLYQDEFVSVTKKIEPLPHEDEGIALYSSLDDIDKAEIRGEMKQMLKAEKYNQENAELA